MSGYISLHRKIFENPLWFKEPFTKAQAWVDLILLANYKDGELNIRGNKIKVKRGQVGWSELKLSERWRWSRGKVKRFFDELENGQQIIQQNGQQNGQQNIRLINLISIVNYDKYQNTEQQNGQQNGQKTDKKQYTNNKDNKNNKRNKDNNNIPEQVGGNDSKVISIGDSEKELFNQALKCFYDYYQNHYGTKYNFTAKDGSHLKQLLKKIESKCREGDKLTDNENILTAFQYFIGNITDKWILSNFTLPIINSKFNEIIINLKNGNDPKLKTRRTINGITGYYSDEDVELLQFYYQSAG